ncbi:DUF1206 domain-containing protein [Blastococcus brunescens]|uniref:DUF1206 domain-containing protein n=1 Tax=Blastococcus brunescens TaxID=1564165 RepID=A0ABZ1AUS6_9ACTN|nr:DUF1206 domain-containing protein [Blastococcus sp. BMG 8361]WRL62323.1 DUF1206 domain-containing protein [Blastococcus sp. BMG 8361]
MPLVRSALDRVHDVVERARTVTDHPVLTHLARAGLIAYGAMHLLIAYLAVRIAWRLRGADADQTGALQTVADGPGGSVLLWAIGLGMLSSRCGRPVRCCCGGGACSTGRTGCAPPSSASSAWRKRPCTACSEEPPCSSRPAPGTRQTSGCRS